MLIKIDGERFINSDHIVMIAPTRDETTDTSYIFLSGGVDIEVPNAIITYITEMLDAATGFTEETPAPLSLESRIALHLHNHPDGILTMDLATEFTDVQEEDINFALNTLIKTHTIVQLDDLLYHVSNPMFQQGKW